MKSNGYCPSCERFIGTHEVCPYCETDSARQISGNLVRMVSLCLTLLALVGIHFAAKQNNPPLVKVASIEKKMSFGWIEVRGRLVKKPEVIYRGDKVEYISLLIDDGSGKIKMISSGNNVDKVYDVINNTTNVVFSAIGTVEFDYLNRPRLRIHFSHHLKPL